MEKEVEKGLEGKYSKAVFQCVIEIKSVKINWYSEIVQLNFIISTAHT